MASREQVTFDTAPEIDVLVFELGSQSFAVALEHIAEVLRAVALSALPNAPAVVEGIINVRGEVVPVLDIRARFGLEPKAIGLDDHMLLAIAGQRRVALRVDRALGLARVRPIFLQQASNLPRNLPHVAGVAVLPDGLLLLHDLQAFLAESESAQLSGALHAVERAEQAGS